MSFPSIPKRLLGCFAAALLCAPLTACGGGGSGGSDEAEQIQPIVAGPVPGAYTLALLSASRGERLDVDAAWGPLQFDPTFNQAEATTRNNDSGRLDLDPEASLMNVTPRDVPGTFDLYDARFGPEFGLNLARSRDGSVMGVMPMRDDWSPGMGFLVQRSRGMTRAEVLGEYHVLGHQYSTSTSIGSVYRGVAVINPEETKSQLWMRSTEGRSQRQRTLEHSIEDDGSSAEGLDLQGGFRPEGDFAAYAGSGSATGHKLLQQLFLIRFGEGLTRASLEGDYTLHRLNLFTPVPSASLGVVSFSGTGLMSYEVERENLGGVIRPGSDPRLGSYFVEDNGEVRIRVGAFDHFDGAMTQDGEVVVLGSYGTDEAPHTILVLLKR